MSKPKKITNKSAAEYLKQKQQEKELFGEALRMGKNIKELAKKRGVKLVQPI